MFLVFCLIKEISEQIHKEKKNSQPFKKKGTFPLQRSTKLFT